MSTVILVEQCPPFIFQLAYRVPTYTHVLISLLAITLCKAFPSLAIEKPPVREIIRKPRSDSLTSTTSTLVETDQPDTPLRPTLKGLTDNGRGRHVSFSEKLPFHKVGTTMKMAISRSKSIKPFVRRISIPARRLSSHVVAVIHHIAPNHHHHHHHDEADSYFPKLPTDSDAEVAEVNANLINAKPEVVPPDVGAVVLEANIGFKDVDASEPLAVVPSPAVNTQAVGSENAESDATQPLVPSPKKRAAFKRAARRASMVLGFGHRS